MMIKNRPCRDIRIQDPKTNKFMTLGEYYDGKRFSK